MEKNCLKCGATSQVEDTPAAACPKCGAFYAKVEAMASAGLLEPRPSIQGGRSKRERHAEITPGLMLAFIALGLALVGYLSWDVWKAVKEAREFEERTAREQAERREALNKDPREVFPAGTVFENSKLIALLDKHYPHAQYKPNETVIVTFDREKYVIKTAKIDNGAIPPPYRIVAVVPASQLPTCDEVLTESLGRGASRAAATKLTDETFARGDCKRGWQ